MRDRTAARRADPASTRWPFTVSTCAWRPSAFFDLSECNFCRLTTDASSLPRSSFEGPMFAARFSACSASFVSASAASRRRTISVWRKKNRKHWDLLAHHCDKAYRRNSHSLKIEHVHHLTIRIESDKAIGRDQNPDPYSFLRIWNFVLRKKKQLFAYLTSGWENPYYRVRMCANYANYLYQSLISQILINT